MKIAFDLDDTLVQCGHAFPLETPPKKYWHLLLGGEKMRKGTTELLAFCKEQRHQLWVYTSSHRSRLYIRKLFWLYGFHLDGVVNQPRHERTPKPADIYTKYPPAFGIDLLVDDSEGVAIEGKRHGFQVARIAPDEEQWVEQVKQHIRQYSP